MSNVTKSFDITVSHKFPDGSIASIHAGTTVETAVDGDPNVAEDLAAAVYADTMADLKRIVAENSLAKEIMLGVKRSAKMAKSERTAEAMVKDMG